MDKEAMHAALDSAVSQHRVSIGLCTEWRRGGISREPASSGFQPHFGQER
jgi:hypothetical protein